MKKPPEPIPVPPPAEQPNGDGMLDPLAEAEGLRTALAEVVIRVGRLITALRSIKREHKTLATVWAGLRQLKLGERG